MKILLFPSSWHQVIIEFVSEVLWNITQQNRMQARKLYPDFRRLNASSSSSGLKEP